MFHANKKNGKRRPNDRYFSTANIENGEWFLATSSQRRCLRKPTVPSGCSNQHFIGTEKRFHRDACTANGVARTTLDERSAKKTASIKTSREFQSNVQMAQPKVTAQQVSKTLNTFEGDGKYGRWRSWSEYKYSQWSNVIYETKSPSISHFVLCRCR